MAVASAPAMEGGREDRNREADPVMNNDTTRSVNTAWTSTHDGGTELREVLALVLVWSLDEPHRIGELTLFFGEGREVIVGRGAAQEGDAESRAQLFRYRPGCPTPMSPLGGSGLSRRQLVVRPSAGKLSIQNIGRRPMLVNEQETIAADVNPGDILEIQNQLVFYCTTRPVSAAFRSDSLQFPSSAQGHLFGCADAHGIVGETPAIWALRERIRFAAQRNAHIMVLGESGTGKELVARALHASSARAAGPFLSRNAATFPPGLIDAELFGNTKNYPNPGMADRPGLIGAAHNGTLFLDEIGELPLEMQVHLLRVLDSGGEYQRLGESTVRQANIRLIGATNRSLSSLKPDFAARFTLQIQVPPFGERVDDIALLVRHILKNIAAADPEIGKRFFSGWDGTNGEPRVSPKLITQLLRRTYSTHTRELKTLLWDSMARSDKHYLGPLPAERPGAETDPPGSVPAAARPEITRETLVECLKRTQGSQSMAWKELQLPSRFALYRLLKKYNIEPGDWE